MWRYKSTNTDRYRSTNTDRAATRTIRLSVSETETACARCMFQATTSLLRSGPLRGGTHFTCFTGTYRFESTCLMQDAILHHDCMCKINVVSNTLTTSEWTTARRYSAHLLYWYKSTNTDAVCPLLIELFFGL